MSIHTRHLFKKLISYIDDREFIVLIGARQTGKTTLLEQTADYLKETGQIVYQMSLEDPLLLSELNKHPDNIYKFVQRSDSKVFVLIDEIQYLDDPSNFLKYLYDKYSRNLKLIVTGSSAFYIDSKFTDSLAGRKILLELYTLSFDEFLEFKNVDSSLLSELSAIRSNKDFISLRRSELFALLDEFIVFGGYPAVVLSGSKERKIEKLKDLLNSYIKRDVTEAQVHNQDAFYKLLKIAASQTGNLLNVNELSNTLGVSVTAIDHYIWILQKCFHITLIKPFTTNVRKELTKMPKIYFNDTGLVNCILNQFQSLEERTDKGALYENYVFTCLRNKYPEQVHFWRTADGKEVDFIIMPDQNKKAFEVKFSESQYSSSKYKVFNQLYPDFEFSVISYQGGDKSINALCV